MEKKNAPQQVDIHDQILAAVKGHKTHIYDIDVPFTNEEKERAVIHLKMTGKLSGDGEGRVW